MGSGKRYPDSGLKWFPFLAVWPSFPEGTKERIVDAVSNEQGARPEIGKP